MNNPVKWINALAWALMDQTSLGPKSAKRPAWTIVIAGTALVVRLVVGG